MTLESRVDSLQELRDALRAFAAARDWDQFHSPKNLAVAVSVEAGELLEHFQWTAEAQSSVLPPDSAAKIEGEMADVLIYLVRLADKLEIDLLSAARRKIALNAERYPVSKAKGSSRKYTEL
jgi:NTP pyrophosphatase (non-canonical NTP hydrolase)